MVEFFIWTVILSFFISAITLGLRIISGEGMILYPLRRFCFSFGKKKQLVIQKHINEIKKLQRKLENELQTDEDINAYNLTIDKIDELKFKSFLVDAWHKPLLTCAPCMCSFHGIIITIYFVYLYSWYIIYIFPFSVFLSVTINTIVWKVFKL